MSTPTPAPRRSRVMLVVLAVVVLAVGGVLAWQLLFGGTAPSEVDISAAVQQAAATEEPTSATGDAAGTEDADPTQQPAAETADLSGTWSVDPSIGTFDVTNTTGTFVGFRVGEELANVGVTEAVGRTPGVTGSLAIADTTLESATIEADLTQIVSDRPRRDDRIQDALGTAANPTGTFELTEPLDVGALLDGETVAVTAIGELTVNGVTNPVEVPLEVAMTGDTVVVTGSFPITFADYEVEAPTAPIVLAVEDHGTVEMQLFLTRE